MDYAQLYDIIPKSHWQWTLQDTQEWLKYIGLNSLQEKFYQSSVDGSNLSNLNEEDFIYQLNITSKIMVKKLMNWITNGLPAFDKYVQSQKYIKEATQSMSKIQTHKLDLFLKNRVSAKQQTIKQVMKPRQFSHTEQPKRFEANQLIIRNVEQSQNSHYYLKEKGGTIGRQNTNEIVILDEFVSRTHAEIIYENNQYYIRDCGSNSGTFLKIAEKLQLKDEMIIQMGSNQFQVIIDLYGNCSVYIIDGPNQDYRIELCGMESYSFGRKQSNFISFPDDQHLSGIHSKIFRMKGNWYIQDIATTNGTWLRLSKEQQQSDVFLLQDKCQFKISSNLIYQCKLNNNNRKTNKNGQQKCFLCKIQDKNAIIMPCKHAIGCWKCLNDQKFCPICQTMISEVVKIFTA